MVVTPAWCEGRVFSVFWLILCLVFVFTDINMFSHLSCLRQLFVFEVKFSGTFVCLIDEKE